MSMVKAKFHLLQIEEKVAAPDSIITPQLCFGERPKTLNAVNVVSLSDEFSSSMVNPVMPVAVSKQAIIGKERIGINVAAFWDFLFDNKARDCAGNIGDRAGVDPAIPLKKPENSDFSSCTPAAVALAMPAEIGLVHFDFSRERCFTLAFFGDSGTNKRIDSLGTVAMDAKFTGCAYRRNFQREKMNELPHQSVSEPAAFDDFLSHDSSIRKVKYL